MEYNDELQRRQNRKNQGKQVRRPSKEIDLINLDHLDYTALEEKKIKHKKRKKKRRGKKILGVFLFIIILLTLVFFYFKKKSNEGYWTIAIFGVDSRDGTLEKGALADAQMICVIDRKTGEIKLLSVYRDTYLEIDSDGTYHKINEAYFKGGHKQGISALERNLDIKIDDYATFNWKAVADTINILGGIDLEISDSEFKYINGFITETVESTGVGSVHLQHAGMNHLDGVQAVAYARLRLMDTDYQRTARQRQVIALAMEKAKQADFSVLNNILVTVLPQLSTSVGIDDLIPIAMKFDKYYLGETDGFPFSRGEKKINKRDCVIPLTLESNVIQLHEFLYGTEDYKPSSTVKKISAQIASDSGMGEVADNAPKTKPGGNSGGQAPAPTQPPKVTEESSVTETEAETEETSEEADESEEAASEEESGEESKEESKPEPETDYEIIGPGATTGETTTSAKPTPPAEETTPESAAPPAEVIPAPPNENPGEAIGPGV